ncbi:T9SS type A sorting domain-containing protein [candidate division WOR-3 bacterium]|nr:T9SS type A sorting domain-containing protein [candidate division WOR-3 bacterium]MCK4528100.1 T9SS type A sorting domain-containing protein [candidate division WOR-3 bacterium]
MKKLAILMMIGLCGLAYGQATDIGILPTDSWYSTTTLTGKTIVYDPTSNRAEVAYIPDPYSSHNLYWGWSTDGGNTWNEMGPIDMGYGCSYPAIAMDGSQTPYIIFIDGLYHSGADSTHALCFTRDESFGAGLWGTPMILSDTIQYSMKFGSIDVSASGDTIVIVSEGDYERIEGTDTVKVHDILFTKSINSGNTFEPMQVIAYGDSFPNTAESHAAESPAIHLGDNGKIFVEGLAKDTIQYPGEEWQKIYMASTDLGATWTEPTVLPGVAGGTYCENWWGRLSNGIAMGDIVYTGVGISTSGNNRLIGYRYRFSTDVFEEYGPIAPTPAGGMWSEATCATFAHDAAGNLFVAFQDKDTLSVAYGYNIFVMGSPDNGHYWTFPLRVGSGLKRPMAPEIAPVVGDSGLITYAPQGWWETFSDSLRLIKFCVDSVFAVSRTPPMVWNVTAYGNTYDEVGPYIIQVNVKDDQPGFSVDLKYIIGIDTTTVTMPNVGGDTYEAEIPGQTTDTRIEYWVKVVDTDLNEVLVPGSPDAGYSILILPVGIVAYDDGIAIGGITEPWGNGFISVMFSPTEAAVETLTTVQLFIWSDPDTFIIHVNPDNGNGKPIPDSNLITPIEAVAVDSGAWMDVNVGELFIPEEDFHIRIEFPLHDRPSIGADKLCDCDRSWLNYDGWWWAHPSEWEVGDLLIRAIMPGYGTGIEEKRTFINRLSQNYPNPMVKDTRIKFAISKEEKVNISVYNIVGQKVRTLIDKKMKAGSYIVNWNGETENGRKLASGVYFYIMEAGDYTSSRKLLLLK